MVDAQVGGETAPRAFVPLARFIDLSYISLRQGREIKITKRTPEFIANIRAEEAEKVCCTGC